MKKIISIFLTLLFTLSVFVFPAYADETVGVLKAGRVTAKNGEKITVPVSLVEHKGVCIIRVTVMYDSKALEYKDTIMSASDNFAYTVNEETEGEVVVLMDSKRLRNYEGDLTLFELEFQVKKSATSGRTLVRVFCEEGMATYLVGTGNKIEATAFLPATSTGSVTILCDKHDFVLQEADDTYRCSKCGAVKNDDGDVSVDSSQGLPEIDVSGEIPADAASNEIVNESENSSEPDGDNKDGTNDLKFVYFIPIIAALVIIGGVLVIKFKKGNKE